MDQSAPMVRAPVTAHSLFQQHRLFGARALPRRLRIIDGKKRACVERTDCYEGPDLCHLQAFGDMGGSSSTTHAQPGDDGAPAAQPVVQGRAVRLGDLITGPEATHWSRLLIQDHLDSGAKLALLGTCTAARDLVLVTAKHATLLWDVDNQAGSMAACQAALATRGKLRTTLDLKATDSGRLSNAVEALQEGTTWLYGLHVRCDEALPTAVLSTIGRCCHNLRSLHVGRLVGDLPSPQLFPKLKELSIRVPIHYQHQQAETIFRTTGPYIKQLTSLVIPMYCHPPPDSPLLLLLSPENVGSHLRTLHLYSILNDTLLGLILQCAPALEELGMIGIQLESDMHAHTQTQWQRLQITGHVHLSSLALLPRSPGLQIICRVQLRLHCDITSNVEAVAVAQLSGVQHSASCNNKVIVQPGKDADFDLAVASQPAALRLGLSQLRSERPNNQQGIELEGWVMSPELMRELPGLPAWGKLQLSGTWVYEQPSYAPLLSLLPSSYRDVVIWVLGLKGEQVEGICLGAPQNRTPEAPLCIRLQDCDSGVVAAIQHKMRLGSFPHVVVEKY